MAKSLVHLSSDDVALFAHQLALRYFPDYKGDISSYEANLTRDGHGRLDSALALTRQPYYRGVFQKAGALLRSTVKNHPYIDGNKRLGISTTYMFLVLNQWFLWTSNDEMVDFAVRLAESDPSFSYHKVARWLREHSLRSEHVQGVIRHSDHHPKISQQISDNVDAVTAAMQESIRQLQETVERLRAETSGGSGS